MTSMEDTMLTCYLEGTKLNRKINIQPDPAHLNLIESSCELVVSIMSRSKSNMMP